MSPARCRFRWPRWVLRFVQSALLGVGPFVLSSALVGLSNPEPATAALSNTEVYVVNADGTGRENLTHAPAPDGFPALSPGGSALAFTRSSTSVQVWVMSSSGTGQRALADGETCCATEGPVWRPGGGLLAFNQTDLSQCYPGAYKCATWQIRTIRPDGSGLLTLLPGSVRNADWAPDGRLLAYEAGVYNGEGYGIEVVDTATLETWQVTSSVGPTFLNPEWSSDGSKLAFIRNGRLVVAGARGGNRRSLVRGRQATWAPDGRRLAFVRTPYDGARTNSVFVVGTRGSDLRRLTRGVLPTWSPDGKRIAFVRSGSLYVMRSDGRRIRLVARGASSQLGPPVWSHDGRRLYYAG